MAILYHKKFKSSIKIAVFKKIAFELFVVIGQQIKTCPDGQVLKLWLETMYNSLTKQEYELTDFINRYDYFYEQLSTFNPELLYLLK